MVAPIIIGTGARLMSMLGSAGSKAEQIAAGAAKNKNIMGASKWAGDAVTNAEKIGSNVMGNETVKNFVAHPATQAAGKIAANPVTGGVASAVLAPSATVVGEKLRNKLFSGGLSNKTSSSDPTSEYSNLELGGQIVHSKKDLNKISTKNYTKPVFQDRFERNSKGEIIETAGLLPMIGGALMGPVGGALGSVVENPEAPAHAAAGGLLGGAVGQGVGTAVTPMAVQGAQNAGNMIGGVGKGIGEGIDGAGSFFNSLGSGAQGAAGSQATQGAGNAITSSTIPTTSSTTGVSAAQPGDITSGALTNFKGATDKLGSNINSLMNPDPSKTYTINDVIGSAADTTGKAADTVLEGAKTVGAAGVDTIASTPTILSRGANTIGNTPLYSPTTPVSANAAPQAASGTTLDTGGKGATFKFGGGATTASQTPTWAAGPYKYSDTGAQAPVEASKINTPAAAPKESLGNAVGRGFKGAGEFVGKWGGKLAQSATTPMVTGIGSDIGGATLAKEGKKSGTTGLPSVSDSYEDYDEDILERFLRK